MWAPDAEFARPDALWALLLLLPVIFWYVRRHPRTTTHLRYSTLAAFGGLRPTIRERLRHLPFLLRLAVFALVIVAVARPRTASEGESVVTEGIDIVLVLDISGSMLAEDFRPNRVEAAKDVAARFVDARRNDRVGLVIFAGESFTQCPMTLDHAVLKNLLREVRQGLIEDGTAIGMAIAQGVNRLKDSEARSRVMILLTDGVNNRGEIDPVTATQIAATYGIRIYTVAVGTIGTAPYPVKTPFGTRYQNVPVEVDEKTLQTIARMTGGQYFRATNTRALQQIYDEIDEMETTRIEVRAYRAYTELFYGWALAAIIALLLEWLLSATILRKLP